MSKKNKLRTCPALGHEISSAECGAGRHARITCPVGCPHDPFAAQNYDALLTAETQLDKRTTQALASEIGSAQVIRIIDRAMEKVGNEGANTAMIRTLFFQRDAKGRSFAERWLDRGAHELSKDDKVFFSGKARMRVSMLEVIEVRSDGLLRVIDLLEPESGERLLLDRNGWARATRFQILLVWTYPLPHYWRMCGGGIIWPEWSGCTLSPPEALAELVAHAGGPATDAPPAQRQAWLVGHFEDMPRLVTAVSDARRRDMLASTDAVSVWSEYLLTQKEYNALDARLALKNEVYPNDLAEQEIKAGFTTGYDICLPLKAGDPTGHREVLGRALVRGRTWRIEAMGRTRLAKLKARFFELLGVPPRAPTQELAQDLGLQMAEKISSNDDELVPPRLRENPERFEFKSYRLHQPENDDRANTPNEIAQLTLEEASQRWADTEIPALDGLTPRAAVAHSPAFRARVVSLLKSHIHNYDEKRLRGKFLPDPQSTVRSLGLTELDVPAPPDRPCPPALAAEDTEENDAEPSEGPGLAPLPSRPLSEDEVDERLNLLMNHFPSDHELVDAWAKACPGWKHAFDEWGRSYFEDTELDDMKLGLAIVWAVLGGADNPRAGHRLDHKKLRAACESEWSKILSLSQPAEIFAYVNAMDTQQPALVRTIFALISGEAKQRKSKPESQAYIFIALSVWLGLTIPELTRAP